MKRALPSYARRTTTATSLRQPTGLLCFREFFWTSSLSVETPFSIRQKRFSSSEGCGSSAVEVTKTFKESNGSSLAYNPEKEELTTFVDDLLSRTRDLMDNKSGDRANSSGNESIRGKSAHHVIAFSGGIDSSVAAALIHRVASSPVPSLSSRVYDYEKATAVLGLSPAVPMNQRKLAEEVARTIGIDLEQISTTEGTDDEYIANDGRACLACKTHLYDNLKTISDQYCTSEDIQTEGTMPTIGMDTILYNGTNADDLNDRTRLGLIAANDFAVRSPLSGLPKERVRAVGRHLGLPNWDYAASPCLRSRLAVGVEATSGRLRNVDRAEAFVRDQLGQEEPGGIWDVRRSLRVRILSKNRAMIEVDDDRILQLVESHLFQQEGTLVWKTYFEEKLGFAAVGVRKFKTGSVAPPPPPDRIATIASPTGGKPRKLRRRP